MISMDSSNGQSGSRLLQTTFPNFGSPIPKWSNREFPICDP
jgi:hypothetical protein